MLEVHFVQMLLTTPTTNLSEYAHMLLNILAAQKLSVAKEELQLSIGKFGKPYFSDHREFRFNISHTNGAITIAFSDDEVGIDVERLREPEMKIAYRYFTSNEIAYVEADSAKSRFFEIWTKKESYIKWLGKGLTKPFKSFDVLTLDNVQFYSEELLGFSFSLCTQNRFQPRFRFWCEQDFKMEY